MQRHLGLQLSDPSELFAARPFDPFHDDHEPVSGMDRITAIVAAHSAADRWTITIAVGSSDRAILTTESAAQAIRRWCDAETARKERELAALRRDDRLAFVLGIAVLALCVFVAAVVDDRSSWPHVLRQTLVDGLIIAGWVAVWRPVDLLLFERPLLRRRLRHLATVRAADISVTTQPTAPSP